MMCVLSCMPTRSEQLWSAKPYYEIIVWWTHIKLSHHPLITISDITFEVSFDLHKERRCIKICKTLFFHSLHNFVLVHIYVKLCWEMQEIRSAFTACGPTSKQQTIRQSTNFQEASKISTNRHVRTIQSYPNWNVSAVYSTQQKTWRLQKLCYVRFLI